MMLPQRVTTENKKKFSGTVKTHTHTHTHTHTQSKLGPSNSYVQDNRITVIEHLFNSDRIRHRGKYDELHQGSPTPGMQTSTGPQPVRNRLHSRR